MRYQVIPERMGVIDDLLLADRLEQKILDRYRQAIFMVKDQELLGGRVQSKFQDFAVVAAFNSSGEHPDKTKDKIQARLLAKTLRDRKLEYLKVTLSSPDGKNREPGFAVILPEDDAVDLGCDFKQKAIFWVGGDDVLLVACLTTAMGHERIGSWRDRARPPPL